MPRSAYLHDAGFADAQIGTVGFCFGGRVTFLIAAERALGAAVGFYGGGIVHARFPQFPALVDRTPSLKTPWLGLFGDQDTGIPIEDVETLRTALADAPVDGEIVRYRRCRARFSLRRASRVQRRGRRRRLGPHPCLVRHPPRPPLIPSRHPIQIVFVYTLRYQSRLGSAFGIGGAAR